MGVGWTCPRCERELNRGTSQEQHAKECDPTDRLDAEHESLEERVEELEGEVRTLKERLNDLENALCSAGIEIPRS